MSLRENILRKYKCTVHLFERAEERRFTECEIKEIIKKGRECILLNGKVKYIKDSKVVVASVSDYSIITVFKHNKNKLKKKKALRKLQRTRRKENNLINERM